VNNNLLILHRSAHVIPAAHISPCYFYLPSESLGGSSIRLCLKIKTPHLVALLEKAFKSFCADISKRACY